VEASSRWQLKSARDYQPTTLLEVQCALLRMCAARGDLFAVLAVPEHYREDNAVRHVKALKPSAGAMAIGGAGPSLIAPLGFGETRALSYGALYYPWLDGREDTRPNELRRVPPDGAALGVMALRALTRGAWVAPANERLRDVVALAPLVERKHWPDLQEAQINLIRREPRGFLSLCADTLSDDPDLRPINVRRLLILLRRMALKLGATYVFEPNNDAFRRLVKRGFEGMLDRMFARGAFAGRTPAASYQVLTNSTLNTRQLMDEGRFIVELKVAPSLPMTFLTIRLVQTGDRLATEER
jgi:phage tail sheath protein FI